MTRWWLSIPILFAMLFATPRADAAMMLHYDLAGLLLQSDAVVVAERVGPSPGKPGRARFHVLRVLRGTAVVGADVDIYDSLFSTDGKTLDREIVLFLDKTGELVSSGMRVSVGGKVFRFEQRRNPGGWEMVPQGEDPIDMWRTTPQLDVAGLERAITAAGKRLDAFAAARLERDPAKRRAAALALFAPPGATRGCCRGFYEDRLAEEATRMLAAAGDVEGALLVGLRNRAGTRSRDFAPVADLLAIARDPRRAIELRITALANARNRMTDDDASLRAVLPFIDDLDPRMRAAAAETGAMLTQVSSDAAFDRRIAAFKAELAKVLAKRFASETETNVLVAIAAVYTDTWKRPLPPRKGGPAQFASARVEGTTVDVDIRCITPIRATDMRVLATSGGVTTPIGAVNIWLHCGAENGVSGGVFKPLAAGRYDLTVELATVPKPTALPLGTLVVDANHDMRVE
jgi:hypothetical protein